MPGDGTHSRWAFLYFCSLVYLVLCINISEIGMHLIIASEIHVFSWEFASASHWALPNRPGMRVSAWGCSDQTGGGNCDVSLPTYGVVVQILGKVPYPPRSSRFSLPSLSVWQAYFSLWLFGAPACAGLLCLFSSPLKCFWFLSGT